MCTAICLLFVRQCASHLYGNAFEKALGVEGSGTFLKNERFAASCCRQLWPFFLGLGCCCELQRSAANALHCLISDYDRSPLRIVWRSFGGMLSCGNASNVLPQGFGISQCIWICVWRHHAPPWQSLLLNFRRVTIRGAQPSARLSEEICLSEGSAGSLRGFCGGFSEGSAGVSPRVLRGSAGFSEGFRE